MNWDAFQREALDELGLRPYQLAVVQPKPPSDVPAAMFEALLRAAGTGQAGVVKLPGLASLHANPAAKRALWPLLRRLRAAT